MRVVVVSADESLEKAEEVVEVKKTNRVSSGELTGLVRDRRGFSGISGVTFQRLFSYRCRYRRRSEGTMLFAKEDEPCRTAITCHLESPAVKRKG